MGEKCLFWPKMGVPRALFLGRKPYLFYLLKCPLWPPNPKIPKTGFSKFWGESRAFFKGVQTKKGQNTAFCLRGVIFGGKKGTAFSGENLKKVCYFSNFPGEKAVPFFHLKMTQIFRPEFWVDFLKCLFSGEKAVPFCPKIAYFDPQKCQFSGEKAAPFLPKND